jgi:peroxiredoxin
MNIGDTAPDFTLKDQYDKDFKLSDFKGKRVLLSFHPLAFTGFCTKQMLSLEDNFDALTALNTVPVGISVDPQPAKKAWADSMNLKKLRIISDFWPHGGVAIQYDMFREKYGTSKRANIIVDEKGKIIFIKIYEILSLPDIQEVISFLKGLKSQGK